MLRNFDPFLMLDEFDVATTAGFPDHPHRYPQITAAALCKFVDETMSDGEACLLCCSLFSHAQNETRIRLAMSTTCSNPPCQAREARSSTSRQCFSPHQCSRRMQCLLRTRRFGHASDYNIFVILRYLRTCLSTPTAVPRMKTTLPRSPGGPSLGDPPEPRPPGLGCSYSQSVWCFQKIETRFMFARMRSLITCLLSVPLTHHRSPVYRGFETVTYMLKGIMEHEDFCGHRYLRIYHRWMHRS